MMYWPWWAGALALATIAVTFVRAIGRSMGVSGSFGRVGRYREERRAEIQDAEIRSEEEMRAALEAATREAFGELAPEGPADDEDRDPARPPAPAKRLPILGEVVFLASIAAGGLVASLARGAFSLRFDLGEAFAKKVATGPLALAILFAGGAFVGFGTRLAGGCTSGHGLAGCARLERASLVATACFFGAAVLVAFALEAAR